MKESILLKIRDSIATVSLNRPRRLNAFDGDMSRRLVQVFEEISAGRQVRVVILRGEGKGFCAGADLNLLRKYQEEKNTDAIREVLLAGKRLFLLLRRMPQPVIAAVNGPAIGGGCSLALSCDWRIAARSAGFSQAFIRLGLHPDWGGYLALPFLVGSGKALELMLTGETVTAGTALELGLVNQVVEDEVLEGECNKLALRFAGASALALSKIKEGIFLSQRGKWEEILDFEIEGQIECLLSDESRAAVQAFLEARQSAKKGE